MLKGNTNRASLTFDWTNFVLSTAVHLLAQFYVKRQTGIERSKVPASAERWEAQTYAAEVFLTW